MKRIAKFILIFLLALYQHVSYAHDAHMLEDPETVFISVVFDSQGVLWRASTKNGFVWADKSTDLGKTFTKPVKVNPEQQNIANNNEARPKIATDAQGNVYLTWTQNLKTLYASYVWFARSLDGGRSFEKPYIVHQNREDLTHAFNTLNIAPNGNITVLWIDGRDAMAAKLAGKPFTGLAIYYALSTDAGKTFNAEQKLADSTCECCRIAITSKPDSTLVAMWRHVFEGSERDHMIAEVPSKNEIVNPHRATFGHWKIDGCPHQGAALATGGEGKDWWGYHMAYFDGKDDKPGLYYSRMDGVAWASSVPKKFGDNTKQAGRPALLSINENVWLVWREIKDGNTSIMGIYSDDGGKNWNEPKKLADTKQKADYPILLANKNQAYLLWNLAQEGLQVIPLR